MDAPPTANLTDDTLAFGELHYLAGNHDTEWGRDNCLRGAASHAQPAPPVWDERRAGFSLQRRTYSSVRATSTGRDAACRMHSRPAEHVLIESQEEVRSDLRSRKFAQIRSIIQAGSGNEAKSRENRHSENSQRP
jgi:hypothetical protein